MIARYRPLNRSATIPITSATGTVTNAASGAAHQNGVAARATSPALANAPTPTNVAGIRESCPTYPVTTTIERPISP